MQQKIDSQLLYAAKELRGEAIAGGKTTVAADIQYLADGRVLVDIKADVTPALLDAIVRTGGTVVNSFPAFRAIRAKILAQRVEEIAALGEVRVVRRAAQAETRAMTSEGDVTHSANTARSTYFSTGAGVKVGVLSDSVDLLATSYANGELSNVTVLPGQAGSGNGEGTAMLEIIRDLAPGAGTPYPSTINVSGSSSTITKVTVTLTGLTHTYPDDVGILLVGPAGQKVLVMANAGGSTDVAGVNLTFDDAATSNLPDATAITSGTFAPTSFGTTPAFTAPAPPSPYSNVLSTFNGASANGAWQLYVYDSVSGDSGSISG